jgi:hypothetical protein
MHDTEYSFCNSERGEVGRTLCMCLILRRKNGSGMMLPQVRYLVGYHLCSEL